MGYFSNTDYVFICDHLLQVCLNKTENINNKKKKHDFYALSAIFQPCNGGTNKQTTNKQTKNPENM